jgi:hypothetical protein
VTSDRGNPRGDLINGDSPPLNRINIFPLPVDLMRCNGSVGHATGELARFPAPFSGVLPDLSVAGDDTHEIRPLAPGMATGVGR